MSSCDLLNLGTIPGYTVSQKVLALPPLEPLEEEEERASDNNHCS
jgi:hypothetical protein